MTRGTTETCAFHQSGRVACFVQGNGRLIPSSFFFSDEILEKQKICETDHDEAKQNTEEKDSLGSNINEGSEGDNPVSSTADRSSRPDSEDENPASEKLATDGKAVLCVRRRDTRGTGPYL